MISSPNQVNRHGILQMSHFRPSQEREKARKSYVYGVWDRNHVGFRTVPYHHNVTFGKGLEVKSRSLEPMFLTHSVPSTNTHTYIYIRTSPPLMPFWKKQSHFKLTRIVVLRNHFWTPRIKTLEQCVENGSGRTFFLLRWSKTVSKWPTCCAWVVTASVSILPAPLFLCVVAELHPTVWNRMQHSCF